MAKAKRKTKAAAINHVGFLLATSPDDWARYIGWFEAALPANVKVTYLPPRGAAGNAQAIADSAVYLAKYFDVIVTAGTGAALALKAATQNTNAQFVYASVGDPTISGLNPQSGGKYTGGSNQQVGLVTRRVNFMLGKPNVFKERFAVVGNYANEPAKTAMTAALNKLTDSGKDAQLASIAPGDDIPGFITSLKNQNVKSLYVCSDLYLTAHSKELNREAHRAQMKTMFEFEEHSLGHGGDDFFGVNFKDLFETAADYVKQILAGRKAGDLPIYTSFMPAAPADSYAAPEKKSAASGTKKKTRRGR